MDADCGDSGKFCEKTQADNYPPGGNGIGDACDCEADFDCDSPGLDVDAYEYYTIPVGLWQKSILQSLHF